MIGEYAGLDVRKTILIAKVLNIGYVTEFSKPMYEIVDVLGINKYS